MAIIMQYGAGGGQSTGQESSIIASGLIEDGNPVVLDVFEAGKVYELITAEYAISNSGFRGMRKILIYAPESALFGTAALSHVNEAASTNAGVTFAWNTDSTLTISQSTYAVKYWLFDVSIG